MFYLSRRILSLYLLIAVILTATLGIFHSAISQTAKEVVAVVTGMKMHPIYAVDIDEKKVAISFDAAWGSTRTPAILQTLAKYKLKTTFFLTNIWLKQYPDLAREIAAAGHEIAMHSATHPRMTDLNGEQIKKELADNAQLIKDTTGQIPYLFRPPFGAYNNNLLKITQENGIVTIQWDVDSLDWKNLSSEEIYQRVTTRVKPGSIVLFHNDGAHTPGALEPIIKYLLAEGYQIVPVSELIYHDNYLIDLNGIQKVR